MKLKSLLLIITFMFSGLTFAGECTKAKAIKVTSLKVLVCLLPTQCIP